MLAPAIPAVLLVLVQISYPLASGVARDRVTVAVVLLSAGTALVHAVATRGIRYALGFVVIVSGLGLVAEIVGTATGFPFGCYAYADGRSGPAVAGVPLVVALAWTGGLYPVWVVAGLLTRRWAGRVVLTAVGAVGWDLFLDPQMVADGQWTWCAAGRGLPGIDEIPYTNYLGWFAVALVMALLLTVLARVAGTANAFAPAAARLLSTAQTQAAAPEVAAGTPALELGTADSTGPEHRSREPVSPISADAVVPVAVFMWTWLGSTLAHAVFLDLPYSAWYGCVGLGVLGVPLLVRSAAARRG
ncbi:carotenoid biosynthesis protein [Nocardia vinacea]|uniref:carotenoid biosynthesis protein n=1 Tax=Nocardia vinacea TaxID=96468 RepID=UPI002E0E21C8|nr:carotenoid biosynthesis protein [Nocardia vinacea]